jgi:hypothetical protein
MMNGRKSGKRRRSANGCTLLAEKSNDMVTLAVVRRAYKSKFSPIGKRAIWGFPNNRLPARQSRWLKKQYVFKGHVKTVADQMFFGCG